MTDAPELRAGDADRDKTITLLREAFAEGRLTQGEFDDRMTKAQEAKTFGELDVLTSDLPAPPPPPPLAPARVERPDPGSKTSTKAGLKAAWGSWLGVAILMNVIYIASGITSDSGFGGYWPIWVWGPWGAAMLIATLSGWGRDSTD